MLPHTTPPSPSPTESKPIPIDDIITYDGEEYVIIKEGQARILYPKGNMIFYNPVQEFNRDMSLMAIRLFQEDWNKQGNKKRPFGIVEGLSATGLRAIRYAKELDNVDWILANDLDPVASQAIERNRKYNQVSDATFKTNQEDVNFLLHQLHRNRSLPLSSSNDVNSNRFNSATTMPNENKINFGSIAVIDLDPYGGASLFLDSAVSAVAEGGMLAITCTDLAVLCGTYAEACFAKYAAIPVKRVEYCHEMAIRILLGSIAAHAARHDRYIKPLVSCFADFYIRIFIRVYSHGGKVKFVPSKMGYLYQCTKCDAWQIQKIGKHQERKLKTSKSMNHDHSKVGADLKEDDLIRKDNCLQDQLLNNNVHETEQNDPMLKPVMDPSLETGERRIQCLLGDAPAVPQLCPHCSSHWKMGGPIWTDPIHDTEFVVRIIDHLRGEAKTKNYYGTSRRLLGFFTSIQDEMSDMPFFYSLSQLCNTLHLQTPKLDAFRSAIVHQGYRISGTHCQPGAVKTDAPYSVILDIMRSWHQLHPAKLENHSSHSPASHILSIQPQCIANFEIIPGAKVKRHSSDGTKLERFPHHPPNWGPGARAGKKRDGTSMQEDIIERRRNNQGRRSKKQCTFHKSPPPTTQGLPQHIRAMHCLSPATDLFEINHQISPQGHVEETSSLSLPFDTSSITQTLEFQLREQFYG